MRRLLALFALAFMVAVGAPAFAQAPPPVIPLAPPTAITSGATAYEQHVIDLTTLTANPASASLADFRAGRFIVDVPIDAQIAKVDALSGYAYHDGAGILESGYGGTLQIFLRDNGTCWWCTGGMTASRNRGTGRIANSIGLLATSENARTGTAIGINNSWGVLALGENYGHVETGAAGGFSLRNYVGGDYDVGAGARISIENQGNIDWLDGLRIDTLNSGGTIGSSRVVFLSAPSGFAPNYAIYSAVPSPSYFAGDIRAAGNAQGVQTQLNALAARVSALEAAH